MMKPQSQPTASLAGPSVSSLLLMYGCSLTVSLLVYKVLQSSSPAKGDDEKQASSHAKRLWTLLGNRGGRLSEQKQIEGSSSSSSRQRIRLTHHEKLIAGDVIDPSRIRIGFRNVGGIDDIKTELYDLVILPLRHPELFQSESGLVSPSKGILLYGPPGTGKTMLAKAIAKESGATFLNVRLSTILNQYLGESNKMVSAVFSLAHKLAPSIVFIDEMDTFLKQRGGGDDSSGMGSIKSEFLTLLDGLLSDSVDQSKPVLVLGATNRPYDVDTAILRRLPRTFHIGLPDQTSRLDILEVLLQKQPMTEEARSYLPTLASDTYTKGFSGSDLKELCKASAMVPIRELMRGRSYHAVTGMGEVGSKKKQRTGDGGPADASSSTTSNDPTSEDVRLMDVRDFHNALKRVKKTGQTARDFYKSERRVKT